MALNLERALIWLVLGFILYFLQDGRFLEAAGIVPNLILVFFFFSCFKEGDFKYGLLFIFGSALSVLIWAPFWLLDFLALFLVLMILYFAINLSPAGIFFNFVLSLLIATVIYSGVILPILFAVPIGANFVLGEFLYNLIVGSIIWAIFGPRAGMGGREVIR